MPSWPHVPGDTAVTFRGARIAAFTLDTIASSVRQTLQLAGNILDFHGRIGGFNFQWAWASGFIAGGAAASSQTEH